MSSSLSLVVLLYLVLVVSAQTSKIFQWQFTATVSKNLPSCQELAITVKPFDPKNVTGSSGIPPYYMMSFAIGGLPKTDLIGTDQGSLKWTVNQPVGTSLMLSVVDSTGSAGGIPPQLYTVVTGQSTACIPLEPANLKTDFVVTANVTESLETCQPWGLRIKGGVPPYNLTLAAINSPIVTNVTMGPLDNAFTYINRADPDRQLLAAISDFTGRWAYGTPIVPTKGSSNVDCIGLVSTSGNSTVLEQQAKAASAALAAAASKKKSSIIAGVVVTLIVLLLLAIGAWYFFIVRKRQAETDSEKGHIQDTSVNPFSTPTGTAMLPTSEPSPGQVLSIISSPPQSPKSPHRSFTTSMTSSSYPTSSSIPSPVTSQPTSGRSNSTNSGRPGFAAFPRTSTRGSAKAMEATRERESQIEESDGELVFQHKDGGTVRELPPPYMNPTTPRP